jgi:hypothetical protein
MTFENHKLTQVNENTYLFKQPRTGNCHIYFHFLVDGRMAITGDLGEWILERCFHPIMTERLSNGYFMEKVVNDQKYVFDSELLQKQLKELANEIMADYTQCEEWDQPETAPDFSEESFYYEREADYIVDMDRLVELFNIQDYESLPDGKKPHPWIEMIVEAYHYIFDKKIKLPAPEPVVLSENIR